MKIYLINIVFLLLWAYAFRQSKKMYCIVAASQWVILSGLRDYSVGSDTYSYYWLFENVKSIQWTMLLRNVVEYIKHPFVDHGFKDPGYNLLVKVFQVFSGNYRVFLIFIALFFTVSMAVWIYKNSEMPWLSFVIYSTLFYSFYAVTGHRQTLATALVVFIGYRFIKERKLLRFLLVSFVAVLIHKSSIVFVPFYFLANIKLTKLKVVFLLLFSFVFSLAGKSLYAPLADILGFSDDMINYDIGGANTYATVLLLVCVMIMLCFSLIRERRSDSDYLFMAIVLSIFSSFFVFQNQSFMRIQQYYSLFIMIMIPELVLSFEKKQKVLLSLCGTMVLIFYLILKNPYYLFFFQ